MVSFNNNWNHHHRLLSFSMQQPIENSVADRAPISENLSSELFDILIRVLILFMEVQNIHPNDYLNQEVVKRYVSGIMVYKKFGPLNEEEVRGWISDFILHVNIPFYKKVAMISHFNSIIMQDRKH